MTRLKDQSVEVKSVDDIELRPSWFNKKDGKMKAHPTMSFRINTTSSRRTVTPPTGSTAYPAALPRLGGIGEGEGRGGEGRAL
jgi:hypothetical protein